MRLTVVAHHAPVPAGGAAGRQLLAVVTALRDRGHEATVICWGPVPGGGAVPGWCELRPAPPPARSWRGLRTSVLHPRAHPADIGWEPVDGVVVADNRDSAPALGSLAAESRDSRLVVHHSVRLDATATGGWRHPATVQEWRSERRAVAGVPAAAALSERVALAVAAGAVLRPTLPLPAAPLTPVEQPVALLLADWSWAPNRAALRRLMKAWRDVRARVPHARLVVAGRGCPPVRSADGVSAIGEVATTAEAMSGAAVLAFPCPASSGPKMKVLDAVLHGLPVVTTPAGVEGLFCGGVRVADDRDFPVALAEVLADPAGRIEAAVRARSEALESHAPDVAVESWLGYLEG